jgi:hypothetical protein
VRACSSGMSPEEGGKLIAGVGTAARERQVGQEPLRLPGWHPDGQTALQACLEATEERQVNAPHHPSARGRTTVALLALVEQPLLNFVTFPLTVY